MKQKRRLRLLAAALLLALLLTGCAGAVDNGTGSMAQDGVAAPEQSVDAGLAGDTGTAAEDRKRITTAELDLDVTDFAAATGEIERQVTALGGYLSSTSKGGTAEEHSRWAEYRARIPAERLEEFLAAAGGAGTVVSMTQGTTDVTADYVDSAARLASLEAQEQRLLELTAGAGTLEDLLLLEDKLTEVRGEIESLTGQLKLYDNQVAYATVTLRVNEVLRETLTAPTFGDRVGEAFYGSWQNFCGLIGDGIIAVIYLLPVLLAVLVLGGAVLLAVFAARRRRNRTPPPPPPATGG